MYDVNNFMENFLLYFLNMLLKENFPFAKLTFIEFYFILYIVRSIIIKEVI